MYKKVFEIRWADLDPNLHLRHTAYNDYAAHVRFACLEDNGFSLRDFHRVGVGPVIFKETTEYSREVLAGEKIEVGFLIQGLSRDGRKFNLRHVICKGDGSVAARILIEGAWFDTRTRKVCPAPEALMNLMNHLPKTEDFQWME